MDVLCYLPHRRALNSATYRDAVGLERGEASGLAAAEDDKFVRTAGCEIEIPGTAPVVTGEGPRTEHVTVNLDREQAGHTILRRGGGIDSFQAPPESVVRLDRVGDTWERTLRRAAGQKSQHTLGHNPADFGAAVGQHRDAQTLIRKDHEHRPHGDG